MFGAERSTPGTQVCVSQAIPTQDCYAGFSFCCLVGPHTGSNRQELPAGALRLDDRLWSSANVRIRLIILIALAVFLVWEIVTRGVAAYLAETSPEMATTLRASEPTALLNLAEKKLPRPRSQKS